jgi:hypothetical protein
MKQSFGGGVFCWHAPDGSTSTACLRGTAHKRITKDAAGRIQKQWTFSRTAIVSHCGNLASGPIDIQRYLTDPRYIPEPGGDSGGNPPQDPTPQENSTNLTLSLKVMESRNLFAYIPEEDFLVPHQSVCLVAKIRNEGDTDTKDSLYDDDSDSIDTEFYQKLDTTQWTKIHEERTRVSNLKKGDSHQERHCLTIPTGSTTIAFKAATDTSEEVRDTNRDDNTHEHHFEILPPSLAQDPKRAAIVWFILDQLLLKED